MKISIYSTSNNEKNLIYEAKSSVGTKCPFCDNITINSFLSDAYRNSNDIISTICQCGNCKQIYFVELRSDSFYNLEFIRSYPNRKFKNNFPNELSNISKDFLEIYDQAMTAKQLGLEHLVGTGLRKSIEFLISDYLKNVLQIQPADKLVDKINQIDIKNATTHATLIRWIGNDETHTEPKFPELDVNFMIKCIDSFVYYLYQEYLSIKNQELLESLKSKN